MTQLIAGLADLNSRFFEHSEMPDKLASIPASSVTIWRAV
jgi:hypothetical protein